MKLSKHQRIFTKHIGLLIQFAYKNGIELTFGEAQRTLYQQKKYVKDGRSRTLKSKHLKRLAVDFNVFIDGKYQPSHKKVKKLGEFWESLDPLNKWGGHFKNFKDYPHFQRSA